MNASVPPRIVVPKWVDPPPLGGGGGGALPLLSPFSDRFCPHFYPPCSSWKLRALEIERERRIVRGAPLGPPPLPLRGVPMNQVRWGGGEGDYLGIHSSGLPLPMVIERLGVLVFVSPSPPAQEGGIAKRSLRFSGGDDSL